MFPVYLQGKQDSWLTNKSRNKQGQALMAFTPSLGLGNHKDI
jgi:hypothetical protein